ncbi:MAG TPA: hypothetical protein VGO92_09195 [Acidimicrobiales bacterium]|jgi:hypothetical protein|nr:hypothetical protein [Acidimicrobiales bacterium]
MPALVLPDVLDVAEGLATGLGGVALDGVGLGLAPGVGRAFRRLVGTPEYEAWLIEWGPSGALDLHDHGGSVGAVHVVSGHLIEAFTDLRHPLPLRAQRLGVGEGARLTATRVHEVWNAGPGTARSVHVYSPPLTTMTYYDHRPDRFLAPLRTEAVEGP